jgi:hypothetical protein
LELQSISYFAIVFLFLLAFHLSWPSFMILSTLSFSL